MKRTVRRILVIAGGIGSVVLAAWGCWGLCFIGRDGAAAIAFPIAVWLWLCALDLVLKGCSRMWR